MQDHILDDANKTIMEKWRAFRTLWKTQIRCVNLNKNRFEFNMNFWQMCWPDNMTSLHVASNCLQRSGWAKLFFSLAKLVAPPKTETDDCCGSSSSESPPATCCCFSPPTADKELNAVAAHYNKFEQWPLRFLEVSGPDIVFRDGAHSGISDAAAKVLDKMADKNDTRVRFDNSFPKSFVCDEGNAEYEHAVEIMTQFVQWLDKDLFKNSPRNLIRCFISKNVFDRSRVLNQHMFFICLRDILWQMYFLPDIALNAMYFTFLCSENGIQELHAKGFIPFCHRCECCDDAPSPPTPSTHHSSLLQNIMCTRTMRKYCSIWMNLQTLVVLKRNGRN